MICPHGRLTWYHPTADGHVTEFGTLHYWRPSKRWSRRDAEFVEPLGAIGPVGLHTPASMSLSQWIPLTGWNQSWREVQVSGNPAATWLEFYDGTAYADTDTAQTVQGQVVSVAPWAPRFALHVLRFTPPENQGAPIGCYASVQCQRKQGGTWIDGLATLYLPQQNEKWHGALLHCLAPLPPNGASVDLLDFTYPGNEVLSEGHSGQALSQGVARETWLFEYEELWQDDAGALYGEDGAGRLFLRSWVLIRNAADLSQWWVYQSDSLRLITGTVRLSASGGVYALNMAPIRYGSRAGYAWPQFWNVLPSLAHSTWNETVQWDGVENPVSGWTVSTTGMADGTLRPFVSFSASAVSTKRPLWWYGLQQHDAVIGGATAGSVTSDTLQHLRRIEVTLNREFKGAKATVDFWPFSGAPPAGLVENAKVALEVGWDDAAGEGLTITRVATQYIEPGSLSLVREGEVQNGSVQISFSTADYWSARVARKAIVDYGQAGGNLITAWAAHVCGRLGMDPATQLTVDSNLSGMVLPFAEIPSLPCLDCNDGDDWQGHLRAVERAANLRIGFDYAGTGGMFVDQGPPEYIDGVSAVAFDLDYDTLTAADTVYMVEYAPSSDDYRNAVKFRIGRSEEWRGLYVVQGTSDRAAGIGDDWWAAVADQDAENFAGLLNAWDWKQNSWKELLVWEGPLRPALRPDQFVTVSHLPDMRIASTVSQIVEHTMVVDGQANEATSRIVAVPARIALPFAPVVTGGLLDAAGANDDLNLFATGGLLQ